MTYYSKWKEYNFTALSGSDLLADGDNRLNCGDTFSMPAACIEISVSDNDSKLSGDACRNERGDDWSGQRAQINENGETTRDNVKVYAEQYHVLVDDAGNKYYLIEIEIAGDHVSDRGDYFSFYGAVPPPGTDLTVRSSHNVSGDWLSYDKLSGGTIWKPDADGKVTIEAEDMTLHNYKVENNDAASDGQVIKLGGRSGSASMAFGGEDGTYDMELAYIDENDGEGMIDVLVNGKVVQTISLDANTDGNGVSHTTISTVTIPGLELSQGDTVTLRGVKDQYEFARIDAVTFCPADDHTPPDAMDDAFSTLEDTIVTGNVLPNDENIDPATVTVTLVSDVSSGTLVLNADGSFTYDPAENFNGQDSFTYAIDDGNGGTDTAVVLLDVTPVNDDPTLGSGVLATFEDGNAVSLDLTTLSNDVDGDALTYSIVGGLPSEGEVTLNSGSILTFDPQLGYQELAEGETTSFDVTIETDDGAGGTATNDITVTVTGVNDAPDANDDAFATDPQTTLAISAAALLSNDTDIDLLDRDQLAIQSIDTTATAGSVVQNPDGSYTYDPNGAFDSLILGETAEDTFTYTITDPSGATDTATVTVTVTGTNTPPDANDDGFTTAPDEGITILATDLTSNDLDADGDALSVEAIDTSATQGVVTDNGDGTFGYDPNGAFDGLFPGQTAEDTFTYTLSDGNGGTDTATVTIDVTAPIPPNRAPDAVDDAFVADAGGTLAIKRLDLLANDADPDGDAISFEGVNTSATQGILTDNGDGTFSYDSNGAFADVAVGETAEDTFTYTISDGQLTDTATVTIRVEGSNAPPVQSVFFGASFVFINQSLNFTFGEDAFTDPDGDALTYSATTVDGSPLPDWLSFDPATRTFSGTPDLNDVAVTRVVVTATDASGQSVSADFPLLVLNGNLIDGTPIGERLAGTVDGDLIQGFAGNDTLIGDIGIDLLQGGEGNDILRGGEGADVLEGGVGNDDLGGDDGDDIIYGGDGNDTIQDGNGRDLVFGGSGDDTIRLGNGTNTAFGGEGNDRITVGGNGVQRVFGEDGDDLIFATFSGASFIDGGDGNDRVFMSIDQLGSGQVQVTLGEGQDIIEISNVSRFNNRITERVITDFETGVGGDTINFDNLFKFIPNFDGESNPFPDFVRLTQDGDDTLFQIDIIGPEDGENFETWLRLENTSVEDFTSDNFEPGYNPQGGETPGDTIIGTDNNDTLTGGLFNDFIDGQDGNDAIDGQEGADTIFGGDGNDGIQGGIGNDVIDAGEGNNGIDGGIGDDRITSGSGSDFIFDGFGSDITNTGGGDDRVTLGQANTGDLDIVNTGDGNDLVIFNAARTGGDLIDLGSGNDTLLNLSTSTTTSRIYTLGAGRDTVEFRLNDTTHAPIITDFEAGDGGDVLDVTIARTFTDYDGATNLFAAGYMRLVQIGDDVSVEFNEAANGDAGFLRFTLLQNVDAAELTADNFEPMFHPDGSPTPGAIFNGTVGADVIAGTDGDDVINPLDGADNVDAQFGNDIITGGDDVSVLFGGPGNDVISGNGTLSGGYNDDQLTGREGNDTLDGGFGDDVMIGAGGDDTLTDQNGSNEYYGGDGNDTINAGGTSERGEPRAIEIINAGTGDDRVNIGTGLLRDLNQATRTVTLGSGQDVVSFSANMNSDLGSITTITDFETGATGDIVNFAALVPGNDGVSNPFGEGFARLVQDGADTVLELSRGASDTEYTTAVIFENTAVDDFTGENFAPGLPTDGSGVNGQNTTGSLADDMIDGSFGDDTLEGLDGNDLLTGGNGVDTLLGGAGDDTLDGSFGKDVLDGGAGDDRLIGGDRQDMLTGGAGADTFVFTRVEDSGDTITDFESGIDGIELDLSGYGLGTPPALLTDTAATNGDAVLLFDSATGSLSLDQDGNGSEAAIILAELGAGTTLLETDFDFV